MQTCTKAIPKSKISIDEEDGQKMITVDVFWHPVDGTLDRPNVDGFGLDFTPRNMLLAQRLARAIDEGAIYKTHEVKIDIYGKSYVCAASNIIMRQLNADLKRIGY
jgi:hypothetical protein